MKFEWGASKNDSNIEKYGVSLEQAQEVFNDPFQLCLLDNNIPAFKNAGLLYVHQRVEICWSWRIYFFQIQVKRLFVLFRQDRPTQGRRSNMRTRNERSELDNFDLSELYDFSNAVRGRFYDTKKVSTTIRLDSDVLLFLKKKASEEHVGYQTLINALLRDYFKKPVEDN